MHCNNANKERQADMTQYQVKLPNYNGRDFFLKKTIFTEYQDTATVFDTPETAARAAAKAAKFHPKKMIKATILIEVN